MDCRQTGSNRASTAGPTTLFEISVGRELENSRLRRRNAKDQSASKADRDFAKAFGSANKVVFSRSLDSTEAQKGDKNARVVHTNLRDEILKLKQEPGKNIIAGGVDVPSQLIELGLVDEYRFGIPPVIAGAGRRLMEGVNLPEKLRLKLVDSKAFPSGWVMLRYLKQ